MNTVENPYLEGGRVLPPAGARVPRPRRVVPAWRCAGGDARARVRVGRLALGRPLDRLARLAALLEDRRLRLGRTSSSRSTCASGGNSRLQTSASVIVIAPPMTTAGTAPMQGGREPRLEGAELVRGADEDALDGVDAAAQRVRRRERDDRRADVHAEHVDVAADRERGEREREPARQAEDDHARRRTRRRRAAACGLRGRRAACAAAGSRRRARRRRSRCAARRGRSGRCAGSSARRAAAARPTPPKRTAKRSSVIAPSRIGVSRMKRIPRSRLSQAGCGVVLARATGSASAASQRPRRTSTRRGRCPRRRRPPG